MRKIWLAAIVGCVLTVGAMGEEIIVKVRPPHAVVETRVVSPGPGYVYQRGYHRWDGHAYAWQSGVWVQPPHAHAKWVDHHWEHRNGGYVFVEGRWR